MDAAAITPSFNANIAMLDDYLDTSMYPPACISKPRSHYMPR